MNKPDFILRARTIASSLVGVLSQFDALKAEYDALDAGNVLGDPDFAGSDVTKSEFVSGISSLQHVADARGSGHATNLYRMKI